MCAVIMAGACTAAVRNGASSSRSSSSTGLSTVGRSRCESTLVSPWPGKCLTQQATPSAWLPAIQASASSAARCGSAPNERSAITGLYGLLLRSSTGAKFQLKPSDLMARATAAPVRCARPASSAAPRPMADGGAGTQVARTTAPPSWSMAISDSGPMTARRSAVSLDSWAASVILPRNRHTARMPLALMKLAVAASSSVPGKRIMISRPASWRTLFGFKSFGFKSFLSVTVARLLCTRL